MHLNNGWLLVVLVVVSLPAISLLVEALRPSPAVPERLSWAPDIPISHVAVNGTKLRYIVAGQEGEEGGGRSLVLLHTLRTQLDMFQRVIPAFAKHFRVYALDYPGHGYSDIPTAAYSAEFFVTAVARFLDRLNIEDAVVVGESIGGSIALLLAARHNRRVQRVIAINPYDYDAGRGLRRSSLAANVFFGLNNVPLLGATVARLRLYPMFKQVLEGGVYRKASLPPALARELYRVGNRRGHYRALMSLVRHWPTWERARAEYGSIDRPVLLVYGDHDWSRGEERAAEARAIPGARMRVIKNAGHFLALDAPDEVVRAVAEFTAA